MTDTELVAAIRKIIRSRPNTVSMDTADLARYDLIVGLLRRAENGKEDREVAGS